MYKVINDALAVAVLKSKGRIFFCKGALFRGKGGPPVLEQPARHLPRQGRGLIRPPVIFLTFVTLRSATAVLPISASGPALYRTTTDPRSGAGPARLLVPGAPA